MNRLRRQILTLGVCLAAVMAGRVYFDRTAAQIEASAEIQGLHPEPPASDENGRGGIAAADSATPREPAAIEVALPNGGSRARAEREPDDVGNAASREALDDTAPMDPAAAAD